MTEDEAVARARALLGVRFRPQGRDPDYGLDCIGVVVVAFELSGVGRDYRLRSGDANAAAAGLASSGFVPAGVAVPGDVLLMHAGHRQLHLAILTPAGFVHADAGLRRSWKFRVRRPGRWRARGGTRIRVARRCEWRRLF